MNFKPLAKYLNTFQKVYGIPGCDCAVYHNHINVFRHKDGYNDNEIKKTSFKDLYFMHSAAKLINCTAMMRMIENGLLELKDKVTDYIPEFDRDSDIETMLREYSMTRDKERYRFNHHNLSKIAEKVTGMTLDEYVKKNIFSPLKMKNSYFEINDENRKRISTQYIIDRSGKTIESSRKLEELFTKNQGCVITTVGDYALFAESLCSGGMSRNGYILLKPTTVDYMMSDLIYNETTVENVFVSIGYNGGLVLIDRTKRITIVYAQHVDNCGARQMEIYPRIRETAYRCLGVNLWSKGFNIFP